MQTCPSGSHAWRLIRFGFGTAKACKRRPRLWHRAPANSFGTRLLEPQEQFRIQNGALYLLDGFKKEYLCGPISDSLIGQARAGEWTFMFDLEFATATAVRVDQFNTRAYSYRCVVGYPALQGHGERPPESPQGMDRQLSRSWFVLIVLYGHGLTAVTTVLTLGTKGLRVSTSRGNPNLCTDVSSHRL
jgi:hypothetical protein